MGGYPHTPLLDPHSQLLGGAHMLPARPPRQTPQACAVAELSTRESRKKQPEVEVKYNYQIFYF